VDSKIQHTLIPNCPGSYIIAGELTECAVLEHKRWSDIQLPEGFYFYCSSARNNGGVQARICRHLNKTTSRFWHIDFLKHLLLFHQIWWINSHENMECKLCASILSIPGAQTPLKGFGASDCVNHCDSHLIYFKSIRSLRLINDLVSREISGLPPSQGMKSGSSTIYHIDRRSF